jgi:hypothetical protein
MSTLHNILTVSRYESKTLFRSWFFRIFSILTLVFVVLFNIGQQTELGYPNGDMVALASKVPFLNLYIINVAQAIIVVFLASEFLKRDKKLDTTEVIYMRSMTNADYVLGKTLGNLWVFILLNIIALIVVAVFNLASPFTQFNILPYIYYFLLISIPTLVYILGFSFFLMSVIRNQAITFILLLGYIAATLFYLQNKLHYLFDYMAFRLPVTWSEVIGFGNSDEIISHRLIYLFLGIGFICLTIMLLKRLSQSKPTGIVVFVIGVASLLGGAVLGVKYLKNFSVVDSHREEMLALNNKYADVPAVNMAECDIYLKHSENKIVCSADIVIVNSEDKPLDKVLFTLNPGLEITKVSGGEYKREKQLLFIEPENIIEPGDSVSFSISYEGNIDESFCFLDIDGERRDEIIDEDNSTVDKRHAFTTPDYLLLTSESRWYPEPGITYASKGLGWLNSSFTDFSLRVETYGNLSAVSQGERTVDDKGVVSFKPETKLSKISLVVGDYETREIIVDSISYQLTYFKGHNFFDEYFTELPDSLEPVIRDLKSDWEAKTKMLYPYKRFSLVEVPVQFYSYEHVWTGARDQAQPEMVLLPEGGFQVSAANFALRKRFAKRHRRHSNETESVLEKEEAYFKRFVSQTLTDEDKARQFGGKIRFGGHNFEDSKPNPYFIIYNYYTFSNIFSSKDYPIFNRVMEAYLIQASIETGSGFMRNLIGMSNEEKGNIALQENSFAEILSEQDNPEILSNLIRTKSEFLFSLMRGAAGPEEFDIFLYDFVEKNRFRELSVDEMSSEIKSRFNLDLNNYMANWYNSKSLPGYIISETDAVRVKKGDRILTMVTLKITNTEEEPGVVSITFRLGGQGRRGRRHGGGDDQTVERIVMAGPKQTKKVSFLLNKKPRMMLINTFSSKNIPSVVTHSFKKIEQNDKIKPFEGETLLAYNDGTLPNEIILDNEDEGFSFVQPEGGGILKKMFEGMEKKEDEDLKYKGMYFWNPPEDWTLTTRAEFYGKQVRSAYYARGGKGERKAVWTIPLKEAGYYKVFGFVPKINMRFGGNNKKGEYVFTIFHDDGEDSPAVELKNNDGGWVELGAYYFSPDSVRIELSNDTEAKMILADAVKLVMEK